jgi:uncharacterized protein YecE (DUF72 family)
LAASGAGKGMREEFAHPRLGAKHRPRMSAPVYLGCPVWAHAPWVGKFFTTDARREDFLPQYASVFGTAEGNATFYGLPSAETVRKWSAEAPREFRFAFKFPRAITHDRRLAGAAEETRELLGRLAPLGERLGPFFLQLHQSFGARDLPVLARYLDALPREFAYAVEVRAAEFFESGEAECAFDAMLAERGVDRVNFDTRGLFASAAKDEHSMDAKRKKPRVPVRFTATARRPFVRFVGDPHVPANRALLTEWALVVARWIAEGRTPYFFVHHPDDAQAPALARLFQELLREQTSVVPEPSLWPIERERARQPRQLGLFE